MDGSHQYRADVDGLRAVAILPVLLYHAGVGGFSGGYVGVDVFFVISGYLITSIIAREIGAGRFSILRFYERRARRILPALVAVIAFVLAGASILYLPQDFASVPRSALAATLFASNVTFFLETGYFQGGAEIKPLLHTWSLGIEEQFYIGFPILLLLIARWAPAKRAAIVGGIALLSFALALATQSHSSGFAFYLLPPRAWELFAGALLALGVVPAVRSAAAREAIAAAGLAAIVYAVLSFDRSTVFPGANALFPVLGAAALIHCARGTRAGRLLASPPAVGIGLISYSLYLWHWPIIVFAEYASDARLSGWGSVAAVAASFGAAYLSWRYIEAPFRAAGRFDRRAIFTQAATAMAAICAVTTILFAAGGWPSRFPPEVVRMAAAAHDYSPDRERCHDAGSPCTLGGDGPPSALLWGDSHGVEYAFALSRVELRSRRSILQSTHSSCPPAIGWDPPDNRNCARANAATLATIRTDRRIGTVYLAAFWASERYASPVFDRGLERTIATLVEDGRRVVIIGPVPRNDFDVPRRLAQLARAGALETAAGAERASIEPVERRLRAIAARWPGGRVSYVAAGDVFCRGPRCDIVRDGRPLYFDSHHPSLAGATMVLAPSVETAAREGAGPGP